MSADKLLSQYLTDLGRLTKICGDPLKLTQEEVEALLQQTNGTQIKGKTFYLALNIKEARLMSFGKDSSGKELTAPGIKDALGHEEYLDFRGYLEEVVPGGIILATYLKSGLATYRQILTQHAGAVKVQEHAYKTYFPLRHINGDIFLYSQTAQPIQVDQEGHLISHLNTYERHIQIGIGAAHKFVFEIGGVELNQEPQVKLTEEIIDYHDKYFYTLIKDEIHAIVTSSGMKIGPRLWRCLYEYLYLTNTKQDVNSAIVLTNIMEDSNTPDDIRKAYGENSQGDLVRRDGVRIREWLNTYFILPESTRFKDWKGVVSFLRGNSYFLKINSSYDLSQE